MNTNKREFELTPTPWTLALMLFLIVGTVGALISSPNLAKGSTLGSNIQAGALAGIDTLIVATEISPMQGLLNDHMQSNRAKEWDEAVVEKLKGIFENKYKLNISSRHDFRSKSLSAENIIVLRFTISAQRETFEGKKVIVASLFPKLLKYKKGGIWSEIYTNSTGYPFIVPKDHPEFLKKLQNASYFVTLSLFCNGISGDHGECDQFKKNLNPPLPAGASPREDLKFEVK